MVVPEAGRGGLLEQEGGEEGMKNLAGDPDADRYIKQELEMAKIELVRGKCAKGEVPATITGVLGEFTFARAWYYWVVKGPLPLEMALKLYENPIGKVEVRVAGHCGCPPPEKPWITWKDKEGNTLIEMKEKKQFDEFIAKGHLKPEVLNGRRFSEEPEKGRGFIESYHIDSQAGLRLFADAVRILMGKKEGISAL